MAPLNHVFVATLFAAGLAIAFLLSKLFRANDVARHLNEIVAKYKDVIDVDSEVSKRRSDLAVITSRISEIEIEFKDKEARLNQDYVAHLALYENLQKEVAILEESLENISYGLYKPQYDYSTSSQFKQKLEEIVVKQKQYIKNDAATFCPVRWNVGGSQAEGAKMTKHYSKLMLRAFNGECDASIAKVRWNNIGNMEARVQKAYDAINKLGASHQISITMDYYNARLEELRLEYELQEKIHQEKEEQRKIREQMREEEKAQREIEKARKEAEDEEERNQKALDKAKAELGKVQGEELEQLNAKIRTLEENLKKAQEQKERAISRAQLTKSGHVYIISNIGSFGEAMYKIGMTRRLEPTDRIDELGDASVPFDFDVHGMIYSENAPELENTLHKKFESKRVNLVNRRAEFFNLSINEIEVVVQELGLDVQLTKQAEAREYRESMSLRQAVLAAAQPLQTKSSLAPEFPKSLE